MKSEIREITREELYQLVWEKAGTILAKEFGISDVGLRRFVRSCGFQDRRRVTVVEIFCVWIIWIDSKLIDVKTKLPPNGVADNSCLHT